MEESEITGIRENSGLILHGVIEILGSMNRLCSICLIASFKSTNWDCIGQSILFLFHYCSIMFTFPVFVFLRSMDLLLLIA